MREKCVAGERESHEDEHFARKLCDLLLDEYRHRKYDTLILIAPPSFLGELRKSLDDRCRQVLLDSIDKDLVKQPVKNVIVQILAGHPDLNLRAMA